MHPDYSVRRMQWLIQTVTTGTNRAFDSVEAKIAAEFLAAGFVVASSRELEPGIPAWYHPTHPGISAVADLAAKLIP